MTVTIYKMIKTSVFGTLFLAIPLISMATCADVKHSRHPVTMEKRKCNLDSVYFDGYYVILYTKKEIKDIETNRQRRLDHKSFQVEVDYNPVKYFVSKDEVAQKGLYNIINDLPRKNKTKVYCDCDERDAEYFSKLFQIPKEAFTCRWPPLLQGRKYYTTRKRSKYCFKIYEVSCWFLPLKIDNDDKRNVMGQGLRYLQAGLTIFDGYYFLGCKSYSNEPTSLSNQLSLWREQLGIFE